MNLTIIGGFKKHSLEKMAEKLGEVNITFHNGKVKHKKPQKVIEGLVKKSDYIVLLVDYCSHQSMWEAKKVAKQYNIPIYFQKGLGITNTISHIIDKMYCKTKEEKFF